MRPRIAVVNSSSFGKVFPEHWKRLEEFADLTRIQVPIDISPENFVQKLLPFHGIVASVNPDYPAAVLAQLPNLVVITRHGIGYNNVDVRAALENGVVVTKVDGVVERASVAEQTLALLLCACRQIVPADKAVRDGSWADRASFIGVELQGKVAGVVGLGNIGSRVAEILAHGFRCQVLGCDPAKSASEVAAMGAAKVELSELLHRADVICINCSLNSDNYHMFSEAELSALKPGAVLVNTARGELVDETALIAALNRNHLRAYATDVVEGEPIGAEHRLLRHQNIIVVPHLGGYSIDSLFGMGSTMVENMESVFVKAELPQHVILPEMARLELKSWA